MRNTMNIKTSSYIELKDYYNNVLNIDKTTYKTSNDEPTPIVCIEEMYNVIPDEVWLRHDLQILDPCCGNGNFHLPIYTLLLCLGYKTEDILENILHFNDLNKDRLHNVHQVYCGDEYHLNITNEDFLSSSTKPTLCKIS